MAQDYDKIFAELLVASLPKLASLYHLMPEEATYESLPADLHYTEQRKADQLWKVVTPQDTFVLHWEIQTSNDPDMLARMLVYYGLLYQRFKLPIRQVVFYIGKEPLRMGSTLKGPVFDFRFEVIDIREASYHQLLASGRPELITLAILAGMDSTDPVLFIREIIRILGQKASGLQLGQHLRQMFMLARLRNLDQIVAQQIKTMALELHFELKDDFFYQEGKAEGEAKGKAEGEAKGKAEGEAKGKAEGEAKGKAEGEAKGKAEAAVLIARRMLEAGDQVEKVMRITGLTREQVDSII